MNLVSEPKRGWTDGLGRGGSWRGEWASGEVEMGEPVYTMRWLENREERKDSSSASWDTE